MFNILGLPLCQAETILKEQGIDYKIQNYPARFKEAIELDSIRVIKQVQSGSNLIITVSEFKTSSQSS